MISQEIHSETVVLDPDAGTYFAANPTGTLLWESLVEETSLGSLQELLMARFGIPPEQAWRDVVEFVSDLSRNGLVTVATP